MARTVFFIFFLCLTGCDKPAPATISFYYWKTTFELTAFERKTLKANDVSRLYVRYFDIALVDQKPVPVSPISFRSSTSGFQIVPVLYIRNEVMLSPNLDVDDLAAKVVSYVQQVNSKHGISCEALQLDCDWSLASRNNYFKFIGAVKMLTPMVITTTIRLHQVKYYERTGIPPVDTGTLMYYNMGHLAADSSNSIYDRKTALRYTGSLKNYPLPLHVALPIFSWGVHIRNNRIIGLLSKADLSGLKENNNFHSDGSRKFFEANQNILRGGRYFRKGGVIKIEFVRPEHLREMVSDLSSAMNKPHEVIYYDLDSINLTPFSYEEDFFQKVTRDF